MIYHNNITCHCYDILLFYINFSAYLKNKYYIALLTPRKVHGYLRSHFILKWKYILTVLSGFKKLFPFFIVVFKNPAISHRTTISVKIHFNTLQLMSSLCFIIKKLAFVITQTERVVSKNIADITVHRLL